MTNQTHNRTVGRRTVLQTSALTLGAIAGISTASASEGGDEPYSEVTVNDQESDGTSVLVERVEMSDGGYVSVHDTRRRLFHEDIEENGIGSAAAINASFIGLTDYLEPGEHRDFEIPLFDDSPWELPGDPPQDPDANRLAESQPVLAIPHEATKPPEFQLGVDGAYRNGSKTLRDLPVVHDIVPLYIEGESKREHNAAKAEAWDVRTDFDGLPEDGFHWTVDFAGGDVQDPPDFWPDDLVSVVGHSEHGPVNNPSVRRQGLDRGGDDALEHVRLVDKMFTFDDDNTEARIEFEVGSEATPTGDGDTVRLHLSSWTVTGEEFDPTDGEKQIGHDRMVEDVPIGTTAEFAVDLPQ